MSSNPYQSPQHGGEPVPSWPADQPYDYVGFWSRALATIVDSLLMALVVLPVLVWFYGWEYFTRQERFIAGSVDLLFNYVLPAVVVVLFWVYKSATPGKMLIGAQIVDADTYEQPSAGQCIIRYLGYYLSIIFCMLGFFWIGFDARKQGWHDKMARTVVVRRR